MAYYRICTHCGANLDPGEQCDCERIKLAERQEMENMTYINKSGQFEFIWEGASA